jgi:hypothetical protein
MATALHRTTSIGAFWQWEKMFCGCSRQWTQIHRIASAVIDASGQEKTITRVLAGSNR